MSPSKPKQSSAKSYPPEFRIQAIKLAQSQEKSISQTAMDLGVPLSTLHTSVQRAENGDWPIAEENISAIKLDKPSAAPNKSAGISQKLHTGFRSLVSAELAREI